MILKRKLIHIQKHFSVNFLSKPKGGFLTVAAQKILIITLKFNKLEKYGETVKKR